MRYHYACEKAYFMGEGSGEITGSFRGEGRGRQRDQWRETIIWGEGARMVNLGGGGGV